MNTFPPEEFNLEEMKSTSLPGSALNWSRLRSIQGSIQELKKTHREIVGLCLYGSLVRPAKHPEQPKELDEETQSDMDGAFFIDAEKLSDVTGVPEEKLVNFEIEAMAHTKKARYEFDPTVRRKYHQMFKDAFQKRNPTMPSEEQYKHLWILPISPNLIDRELQELQKNYEIDSLEREERITPSLNIEMIFLFDIGADSKRYRSHVIHALQELGEVGQKIWTSIIDGLSFYDIRWKKNIDKLPATLEKAEKRFCT